MSKKGNYTVDESSRQGEHKALPYGVVTLYDVLQFGADFLIDLTNLLREMETLAALAGGGGMVVPEGDKQRLVFVCAAFGRMCEFHGWRMTRSKATRVVDGILDGSWSTQATLYPQLRELRERLEDELEGQHFLHLEARDIARYTSPELGWEDVLSRFPETKQNIVESAKCFALERYGAAVFHNLLVAEYGVIKLAVCLGVEGDKPGWGALQRLEKLIAVPYPQREAGAQEHSALLEDTVGLAKVIKDSWRHKLMHVDNQIVWADTDFSREVAEEIITATRGFMRKLARELPEAS